jgi:hypothetical protein
LKTSFVPSLLVRWQSELTAMAAKAKIKRRAKAKGKLLSK